MHETNVLSNIKATLKSFEGNIYLIGGDIVRILENTHTPVGGALAALKKDNREVVPLLYAAANPCGESNAQCFYALLENLLGSLSATLPVDGVLLILHGAMTAESVPDCEGIILKQVRKIVGNSVPIVVVLDFHANISRAMFNEADILVGYDRNPHIDCFEKGAEAVRLLDHIINTKKTPCKRLIQLPLVLSPLTNWTDAEPFHSTLEMVDRWRQNKNICCITATGGFAYSLGEESGVAVAVYGENPTTVDICARDIAGRIWMNRQAALYAGITVEQAIGQALFSAEKTAVLADMGDNIGGGAPGDGTQILRQLIDFEVGGAFVTVCDPIAAAAQPDYFSGEVGKPPVLISGKVIWRGAGTYHIGACNPYSAITGTTVDMGDSVLVDTGKINVLITSKAAPQGDLDMYDHIGIDSKDYKILVVKGAVAFREAYKPVSNMILDVNTDGVCNCDLTKIPYIGATALKYPMNRSCEWTDM